MPDSGRNTARTPSGEAVPFSTTFPVITLLTDFGSRDTYVGQMKGAILSVCPHAHLVDLTHEIPPGNVMKAAIAWADSVAAFPPGTIHLGVVDPGVGSNRRAIASEIGRWRFVCPDNGLVTLILQSWPLTRVVELSDPRWRRSEVSSVFHGRDIFGPVAGHWAAGRDVAEFGPPIDTPLTLLEIASPQREGGTITGSVLTVDQFGNLRADVPGSWLTESRVSWRIEIGTETIYGLSNCFADVEADTLIALIGSHGHLEIAVNRGDAAARLGASPGWQVCAIQGRLNRGADSAGK